MNEALPPTVKILDMLAAVLPQDRFWLVGGSVRDLMRKCTPVDYDIAVMGNPADFAAAVARKFGSRPVAIGPEKKRIHRVVAGPTVYDFSRLAGDDIEADLRRRDFTVNAMALCPADGSLVDPLGGQDDLKAGRIRMVSEHIFENDAVRLIRAFRMAAVFRMKIDAETEAAICRCAGLIGQSAAERVRDELLRLLGAEKASEAVVQMYRCGVLGHILPELAALSGCAQDRYHSYDALTHTLLVLSNAESILSAPRLWLPRRGKEQAISDLGCNPAPLKMAALLHDIGKPAARGTTEDGRAHFRGHAKIGAETAKAVFTRLRLSNRHRQFIGFMIRHHILPLQLFIAHQRKNLTRRGLTRFYIRCGATTPALLVLALADMAGKGVASESRLSAFSDFADEMLDDYFGRFRRRTGQPPLLSGRDLIESLGLSPSPKLGKILSRIEAERLEGRLNTRQEAIARARELV